MRPLPQAHRGRLGWSGFSSNLLKSLVLPSVKPSIHHQYIIVCVTHTTILRISKFVSIKMNITVIVVRIFAAITIVIVGDSFLGIFLLQTMWETRNLTETEERTKYQRWTDEFSGSLELFERGSSSFFTCVYEIERELLLLLHI